MLDKENSLCKYPETRVCLSWLEKGKKASMAGARRWSQRPEMTSEVLDSKIM